MEETVSRQFILSDEVDVIINVVDASRTGTQPLSDLAATGAGKAGGAGLEHDGYCRKEGHGNRPAPAAGNVGHPSGPGLCPKTPWIGHSAPCCCAPQATFMRMKEDHMLNGQLKPAYNVQIAVENYFIVHGYVSNDRTDYNTLIPVLEKHRKAFGDKLEAVTADSGYCSEKNLLYLKENGIRSFIKLQDHEKRKTQAYKEDIGKYYNMTYSVFEDEHYYICHDGRELRHIRTESREQDGYTQTIEVYGCADCSECEYKSKCLYRYNPEKNPDQNKVMKINERWEELREESNMNIQSEEGILKRQTRSIQTEGHFGDIKENENFRRFNYRSKEKVYKEFMLYAIGRNIMKYHRFLHQEIEKFEGEKGVESGLAKGAL